MYSFLRPFICFSDVMPKILGGFVAYGKYGMRFEWGTFYDKKLEGISHPRVSHGKCTLDMGDAYCYQKLIISRNNNETEKGYNIKGGYVKIANDGSIKMRWGNSSAGPGLSDTIVANGEMTSEGNRLANVHFLVEQIEGVSQFDCFSNQFCSTSTSECVEKIFLGTIKNTSVAHQFADFSGYHSKWYWESRCKSYIWI